MVRTSFFVALACSLFSLCCGLSMNKRCNIHHGWNLVPVVVAAVDVPAGTPLTFDMLSQRSVPEQFVTSTVVKPEDAHKVIGKLPRQELVAGDPLRWSDFPGTIANKLVPGAVAVALELPHEVYEGDHVDLLLGDSTALVANARVLSTGTTPWLEVSPTEAKAVAQRKPGGITLVLHGR